MEFWGIEIKPGKPFKVIPGDGNMIHVSQVTLGDSEKVKGETVPVYVKVGDDKQQKLILGNLSKKIPQVSLDLVFEQEFELSHECKSSSVFVLGYMSPEVNEEDEEFDSDDEEIPMDMFQKKLEKSNANELKDQKAVVEVESDDEDESDSDEMGSDDEDEDDSDEEEEAPLKVEPPSKKRPNGGAVNNKNTNASKKAKVGGVAQKSSGGHKGHKCGGVHPHKKN